MKLTVLMDNNTLIDRYFCGEPAVSYHIQDGDTHILFDVGYSDGFIQNSIKMNIDLHNIHSVVISHGHNDHTWGLFPLIKLYSEAVLEKIQYSKPDLIAHPYAFLSKQVSGNEEIGSIISEETLSRHFHLNLTKKPVWLTDQLVFLGEIERKNDFENKVPIGKFRYNGEEMDDYLLDDSALVYQSEKGLVVITGCSHSGICNIIEYAKKICKDERIVDVVGGFHLLDPTEALLRSTSEYIKQNNIKVIHAGHCTDLRSKIELSKVTGIEEVGVGLVLEY